MALFNILLYYQWIKVYILGIFPFHIDISSGKLNSFKWCQRYGVLLGLVVPILRAIVSIKYYEKVYDADSVKRITLVVLQVFECGRVIVSNCYFLLRWNSAMKIFTDLSNVFKHLRMSISMQYILLYPLLYSTIMDITFFFFIVADGVMSLDMVTFTAVFNIFSYIYSTFGNFCVIQIFHVVLYVYDTFFGSINLSLEKELVKSEPDAKKLQRLSVLCHQFLCVSNDINIVFELPFLSQLLQIFLSLSTLVYIILSMVILEGFRIERSEVISYMLGLSCCALQFLQITEILRRCDHLYKQVSKTF